MREGEGGGVQRENYSVEKALTHYVQNKSSAVAERARHNHLCVAAAHFVPDSKLFTKPSFTCLKCQSVLAECDWCFHQVWNEDISWVSN